MKPIRITSLPSFSLQTLFLVVTGIAAAIVYLQVLWWSTAILRR